MSFYSHWQICLPFAFLSWKIQFFVRLRLAANLLWIDEKSWVDSIKFLRCFTALDLNVMYLKLRWAENVSHLSTRQIMKINMNINDYIFTKTARVISDSFHWCLFVSLWKRTMLAVPDKHLLLWTVPSSWLMAESLMLSAACCSLTGSYGFSRGMAGFTHGWWLCLFLLWLMPWKPQI